MVKVDIERQIMAELHELSIDILQEVLDFMRFLQAKKDKIAQPADMLAMQPQHCVGQIHSTMRREEMYDDAR